MAKLAVAAGNAAGTYLRATSRRQGSLAVGLKFLANLLQYRDMLKIRLQRTGRSNSPSYRVVVTEHTNGPKSGRATEVLGSYNPKTKERVLNTERILHWLSKGAQASGTMHNMLISAGIIKGKKINVLPKKTVEKKEEPVAEAAPTAETSVAESAAEETKAEEVAAEGTPAQA